MGGARAAKSFKSSVRELCGRLRHFFRWLQLFAQTDEACADEGGVSFWLPGIYGSLAAAPQQPGWSFAGVNYFDSVSASGSIAAAHEVTVGKFNPTVNANLNVNVNANLDLDCSFRAMCLRRLFLAANWRSA